MFSFFKQHFSLNLKSWQILEVFTWQPDGSWIMSCNLCCFGDFMHFLHDINKATRQQSLAETNVLKHHSRSALPNTDWISDVNFLPQKTLSSGSRRNHKKNQSNLKKRTVPTNTAMTDVVTFTLFNFLRHQVFSWKDLQKTECRIIRLAAGTTFRETREELIKREMDPFGFGSVSVIWA